MERNVENVEQFVQWWKETTLGNTIAWELSSRIEFEKCKKVEIEECKRVHNDKSKKWLQIGWRRVKIVKKGGQKKKHKGQEKNFLTHWAASVNLWWHQKKNIAKVVVCNARCKLTSSNGFFGATYHCMILPTLKLGSST